MPKIKVEVEVPSGKYCYPCSMRHDGRTAHYHYSFCIAFEECLSGVLSQTKKCPACLKSTRAKERG